MRKNVIRSMAIVGAMVMALATPVYAMEDGVVYSAETAQTRSASSPTMGSVKDNHGNGYNVYGYSDCSGKVAIGETGFAIYHYDDSNGDTQDDINKYKKTLSVKCTVQTNNYGEVNTYNYSISSVTKTGKNGSHQKSYSHIYGVTYVKTAHTFSCEGASWNKTTYN
uniref:hypothetical protein n=1 Tax=Agathobacter sp. TaxID=2021311 RepID=UPI00405620DB